MVLWFVVFSILGVYVVFRDEYMDYRLVALGSLLPDVVDGAIFRGIGPLHSVIVAVGVLFGVVAATVGRRALRKRLLAIPIGIFAHQVLDASWAVTHAFWWPVAGLDFTGRLPVVQHGLVVGLIQEGVAVAAAVAMWRAFGFNEPARLRSFRSTGHLPQQRPKRPTRAKRPGQPPGPGRRPADGRRPPKGRS